MLFFTRKRYLRFIVFLFFNFHSFAQETNNPISKRAHILLKQKLLYQKQLATNHRIYNGYLFKLPDFKINGSAFYKTDSLKIGSLTYDNIFYENVPLLFDLNNQTLITPYYNNIYNINLISQLVAHFNIEGDSFIRVSSEEAMKNGIEEGFYQVLIKDQISLLARRVQVVSQSNGNLGLERYFVGKVYYYICANNQMYPVSNPKSISKLFPSYQSQINQIANKENLNFNKNKEASLMVLVERINKITKNQ
jgi:hypothetical protein